MKRQHPRLEQGKLRFKEERGLLEGLVLEVLEERLRYSVT
jgi:hypothetical protein